MQAMPESLLPSYCCQLTSASLGGTPPVHRICLGLPLCRHRISSIMLIPHLAPAAARHLERHIKITLHAACTLLWMAPIDIRETVLRRSCCVFQPRAIILQSHVSNTSTYTLLHHKRTSHYHVYNIYIPLSCLQYLHPTIMSTISTSHYHVYNIGTMCVLRKNEVFSFVPLLLQTITSSVLNTL